jgi:hypothetical protein
MMLTESAPARFKSESQPPKATPLRKGPRVTTTVSESETDSESDDAFEAVPQTPSRDSTDEDAAPAHKVKGVIGGKSKGKKPSPRKPEREESPPKKKSIKGVIGKAKSKATSTTAAKSKAKAKDTDESSDGFDDEPPATRTRAKGHVPDDPMEVDDDTRHDEIQQILARKDLPFNKKKDASKQPEPMEEDSETEDEL